MTTRNKHSLKAFVRYDFQDRVVPGSLILQKDKPSVGDWGEIDLYKPYSPSPINI
jgi:hypothetical protein